MMTCFSHLILWTLSYLSSTEKVNHKHDKQTKHGKRTLAVLGSSCVTENLCEIISSEHPFIVRLSPPTQILRLGQGELHRAPGLTSWSRFISQIIDCLLSYRDQTHYGFLGNSPRLVFKFSEGFSDFWLPVINSLHPPTSNRIYYKVKDFWKTTLKF